MRSAALTLLKIIVALALVAYVIHQVQLDDQILVRRTGASSPAAVHVGQVEGDWRGEGWTFTDSTGEHVFRPPLPADHQLRPGFLTLIRGVRPVLLGAGVALWLVLLLFVTLRWMILLAAAGVRSGYGDSLRLCFIGYFFSMIMPGLTSGDLVRAVLVTRGLESHRARAAVSVLVDRVLGLFSLLSLAGAILLVGGIGADEAGPGLAVVRRAVFLVLLAAVAGGAIYLSRRARRWLGIEWVLQRLPFGGAVAKVDDAVTVYRHRPAAVGAALALSVVLQAAGVVSFWCMARALGADLSLGAIAVIFPVVQTISSVPINPPSGWGSGEFLYGTFFRMFHAPFTLGVAVSVLFRLATQLGFGLAGGAVWLLSREHKLRASLLQARAAPAAPPQASDPPASGP